MPKYVIERTVPGAGQMDDAALQAIAAQSNAVLREIGPDDPVGAQLRERRQDHLRVLRHRRRHHPRARAAAAASPCDVIELVHATIDPTTAAPLA